MLKTKIYDPNIGAERIVFQRPVQEAYGPSWIWLQPLEMGNSTISVEGQEIWLPVLNIKKYYPSARCYALIEKLSKMPMTMVDVIYSHEEILDRLENDEGYLERFLLEFSRTKINRLNLVSPALTVAPQGQREKRAFVEAMKSSIQDGFGNIIVGIESNASGKVELPESESDNKSSQVKEDGIVLEFIKDFYEAISGKPVKRQTAQKPKKFVEGVLTKKAMLMKSGAIIVPGENVGKYYTNYFMRIELGEDVKEIKDTLGLHIEGVDDNVLITGTGFDERKKKFGDILFDSTILETFSSLNPGKEPLLMFGGRYNEDVGKFEVDRRVGQYFDELNAMIIPKRPAGDGR